MIRLVDLSHSRNAMNTDRCEHLPSLRAIPASGSRFSAVPPRVTECGSFPARPFAVVEG
jgi:kynurenine formamidase